MSIKSLLPSPKSATTSTIFFITFAGALVTTLSSSNTTLPPCPAKEAKKRNELNSNFNNDASSNRKFFKWGSRRHEFIQEVTP